MISMDRILKMIDLNPGDFENVHGFLNMVELSIFEKLAKKDMKEGGMFTLGADHKRELAKFYNSETEKVAGFLGAQES
jgi:hypothetical protein